MLSHKPVVPLLGGGGSYGLVGLIGILGRELKGASAKKKGQGAFLTEVLKIVQLFLVSLYLEGGSTGQGMHG